MSSADKSNSNRIVNIRRFRQSRSGNIGMMASFMIIPISLMLGASIDFLRLAAIKSELAGALDSGILAAANLDNAVADSTLDSANVEAMVRDYIALNVDTKLIDVDSIDITTILEQTGTSRKVSVDASYTVNTVFLHLLNTDSLEINASSAAEQSFVTLEVSMALDISSSMEGTRLINLKDAANTFVDTMLTDDTRSLTTISIVPFGGTVNLGDDFLGYVDPSTIDPDGHDLDFSDGHAWNGCFEMGVNDFDEDDFESTNNANVPHFWKYRDFNPWCPGSENESIFLSNDNDDLKTLINNLSLSDGTGMDIGAALALKSLSPAWRGVITNSAFPNRPTDFDNDTLKVLIIMTDGAITLQHRPNAQNALEATGVGCIEANTRKKLNPDIRTRILCQAGSSGRPASGATTGTAWNNFYNVCDIAKEKGIIVYTIGFQINAGSTQDQALYACPQTPSNYYWVEDTDIASAFASISASINGLRLVK